MKRIILALSLVGSTFFCSGCNLPYVIHSGLGEARILARTVPMDHALNCPNLSAEDRAKLLWVREVREYAREKIGLKAGKSYLGFYDTQGKPVVYNLSASRRDALRPYSWTFPIVGKFDYLGYFAKAMAESHARQLEKDGYDTVVYEVSAYSTAGWFPDPLFSSLLKYDKPLLADTVIHELTHNTVFMKNDSDFTESVANFVGEKGSREFLKAAAGEDSGLRKRAIEESEDRDLVNKFLDRVYRDLEVFYGRPDLSSKEKIARRGRIFLAHREKFKVDYLPRFHHSEAMKAWGELPVNNARILLHQRYNHRTDVFEKVYQVCDCDLHRAVGVFVQATASRNAWRYLQDWLGAQAKDVKPAMESTVSR